MPFVGPLSASNGQVLILSGGAPGSTNEASGADVNFYVSGSKLAKGYPIRATALFGGDLVVSGAIRGGFIDFGGGEGSEVLRLKSGVSCLGSSFTFDGSDEQQAAPEGEDIVFGVSGSIGGKDQDSYNGNGGTAAFGGDLVISGGLYIEKSEVTVDLGSGTSLTQNTRAGHIRFTTDGTLTSNNYGQRLDVTSSLLRETDVIRCTTSLEGIYAMASSLNVGVDSAFRITLFNWTGDTLASDTNMIINWSAD